MKTTARLAAVQATYMIAYSQCPVDEVIKDFVDGNIGRFVIEDNEFGGDEVIEISSMDKAYFEKLVRGVHSKKEELEKSLNLFLNSGWSIERLDGTLQALLLCAIFEISNTLDVDVKVVMQEYVDLAYAFFSKNEPKMVNALLDQIAKEVRSDF
jgi:N utilization substance protein B